MSCHPPAAVLMALGLCAGTARGEDLAPKPEERQLPYAMHSRMSEPPAVRVGRRGADVVGADHRALQAAVDYVAGLGGGVVEVAEGEYQMGDSLHLRSDVTVRGVAGKTVLRKADAASSPLALDGDFGEQQITVKDPAGFAVGAGVAVWDDHSAGFHHTVARITGRNGNTFALDRPLMADYLVSGHAAAATVYPVVSGVDVRSAQVEGLVVEGNKGANPHLNGCRGAGIYFYRGFGVAVRDCQVRDFHGDGISFQQSNDVTVEGCVAEGNTHLGIHPGSGSQRAVVRNCVARRNGTDGLFLCWRVRHGVFEGNRLEDNGQAGISIGHKDSDNVLRDNRVARNGACGVLFREESAGMSPHRNRLERNVIEDNGRGPGAAGVRIRGKPDGLVFEGNIIRDGRAGSGRTQTVGVLIEGRVGAVRLERNAIEAGVPVEDRRAKREPAAAAPHPAGAEKAVAPKAVELWPGKAPGATGDSDEDKPAVYPYLPPPGANTGAAVLICPGGGFTTRCTDYEGVLVARWLNARGIAGFVLRYRIRPLYDVRDSLRDARRAVQYLRANADAYHIAPDRVGILGFSAGAALAAGATFDPLPGKADAADPVERFPSRADFMVLAYGGGPPPGPASGRGGPPAGGPAAPPTFLFCTAEDARQLAGMADLYAELRRTRAPVEAHFFERGEHGVGFAQGDPVLGTWPDLMYNWARARGFLTGRGRVAVGGVVKVDGEPLPHGSVTFTPLDGAGAPPVTAYVLNGGPVRGRYAIPADRGLTPGRYRVAVRQDATRWVSNARDPVTREMSEKQRGGTLTDEDREAWRAYARKKDLSPSIEGLRVFRRRHPGDGEELVVEVQAGGENHIDVEVFGK